MSDLFVDTSGWGNLIDVSQPFHPLAATLYRLASQQNKKIITTNYIITELVALLTSPYKKGGGTFTLTVIQLQGTSSCYLSLSLLGLLRMN